MRFLEGRAARGARKKRRPRLSTAPSPFCRAHGEGGRACLCCLCVARRNHRDQNLLCGCQGSGSLCFGWEVSRSGASVVLPFHSLVVVRRGSLLFFLFCLLTAVSIPIKHKSHTYPFPASSLSLSRLAAALFRTLNSMAVRFRSSSIRSLACAWSPTPGNLPPVTSSTRRTKR